MASAVVETAGPVGSAHGGAASVLERREILKALRLLRRGDFSVRLPLDLAGIDGEIACAFNEVVELNDAMTRDFERVSAMVGREGMISERVHVHGATGSWAQCVDSINRLVGDMSYPVSEVARVIGAVARGNLAQSMNPEVDGRPVRGEYLRISSVVNTMVDQLASFASEVTRVAREVGTEGKLGGQAQVEGVAGTWKDLTDSVNHMAANLTGQVRNIAEVSTAIASGNLSKKITVDVKGEILELKNTINTMVDQLNSFASEVTRVAREVGTEGKLGGQARVEGVAGTWKDLTDNVNHMAANLTGQVRNIAEVTTAVASGNLSKKITVDVKGEILELKNTVNTMVDQLNSFASEVTRVAREVGTEGKLGGQAKVEGVAGTWKDLTDNVNHMAANLTGQVRNIAEVVTSVANGDLKRKLVVEAKGEIAALANTINGMIDTLATFAAQVTNVAREVGTAGKLGGQASVPGAAGLWRDLTDNVNQLAANLTTQVRAIAEVATAVTNGDLTRFITVEASGEVASLKDNINEMIRNLKDTTRKNTEQDWLKTNIARFNRLLQGQRNIRHVSNLILSQLVPLVNAHQALFYVTRQHEGENVLELAASYAAPNRRRPPQRLRLGDGLIGQCAVDKRGMLLTDAPHDYMRISSGLGESRPSTIIVLPALFEGEVKAVLELASFERFSTIHTLFLDQLMESIGIVLNTLAANMQTEALLAQSQLLTAELQSQQGELKKTNDRLEQQATTLHRSEDLLRSQQEQLRGKNEELVEKANLLSWQNKQVEAKNQEVERAKKLLEEKAEQLALTSKYKCRVPGEHVARAAHAAQQPADPLQAAGGQRRRQSELETDRVRADHPSRRHRAAGPDQRHPRLVEDRVGHGHARRRHGAVRRDRRQPAARLRADRQRQEPEHDDPARPRAAARHGHRRETVAADPEEPAVERIQVHAPGRRGAGDQARERRLESRAHCAQRRSRRRRLFGHRHRHRHPRRQAACHFRSVPAGRRHHQPQVRRHRARPVDQSRDLSPARRRDHRREHAGQGQPLHAVSADRVRLRQRTCPRTCRARCCSPASRRAQIVVGRESTPLLVPAELTDDRQNIQPGEAVLLIIEDDAKFGRILLDLAHDRGFKAVVSATGSGALPLVRRFSPALITLDINLPDMDGWRLLDILKRSPDTRHIPIHIISVDDPRERGLQMGAFSVLEKPVDHATLQQALARTGGVHRAARQGAAAGGGRRPAAGGDRQDHRQRRRSRHPRAQRRRGAAGVARAPVRLRSGRPGVAGHGWRAADRNAPP